MKRSATGPRILLIACRLVQGFGLGGEWGGAVLMAVEHARRRRGFLRPAGRRSAPLGLVLGTLVFSIVSSLMTDAELYAWAGVSRSCSASCW